MVNDPYGDMIAFLDMDDLFIEDDPYDDECVHDTIDNVIQEEEETLWTFGYSDVEIFYTAEEGCSLIATISPLSWIIANKQQEKYKAILSGLISGYGATIEIFQDDLDDFGFFMDVDYDKCSSHFPPAFAQQESLRFVWDETVSELADDILNFTRQRCDTLCATLRTYDGSA